MENSVTPREPFRLKTMWQLCDSQGPRAPARMFQWEAINDLPDPVYVSFDDAGYYFRGGFRLVRRFADMLHV